jgi:hypothetical protein
MAVRGTAIAPLRAIMRLLPVIHAALPYLLVFWLIPFLVIAVKMMRRPAGRRSDDVPHIKKRDLFSPAQRLLLGALEQAVGDDFRIFGKVPVMAVIGGSTKSDQSPWKFAIEEIRSTNFDFVLCDKEDLSICGAVALHANSAGSASKRQNSFLEDICRGISLPLIQIQEAPDYSVTELRKMIAAGLTPGSHAAAGWREEPFSVEPAVHPQFDDRPWTLEESPSLAGRRREISGSESREAAWKLTSDVER